MSTPKVASLKIAFEAESAKLLGDMKKIISETKKMGKRVDRESNRIKYAFNKIRRAAQVVASAFIFTAGIKQLGSLVSGMATAEDKVKLLEARFQQFARVGDSFTRVYNLSKELGVSLDETAGGMTRLLVATKSIGTAQSTLEDVYKNIVLLGRAGGTSTEEMIGGMRQLSQGLASGRLQGEELRSVLENLPLVAMEIADEMGVGIGQIRKLAAEGKITGEVVIAALENIGIKMEDLPKTWGMQTENLRTEWDLFLADLSQAVDEAGLLEELTEAVKWVRLTLLGSFKGVSTPIVKSRMLDEEERLNKIKESLKQYNFDPEKQVLPPAPPMFGGPGMYDPNAALRALIETYNVVKDRLGEYNKELDKRAKLEEIAARAAEASAAAAVGNIEVAKSIEDMIADKLLKEIPLLDPYDELAGAWERIGKAKEDAARRGADIFKKTRTDTETFIIKMKEARDLLNRDFISQEVFDRYKEILLSDVIEPLDDLKDKSDDVFKQMAAFADQAARNMQDAFADFLFDPFESGLRGLLKSFIDTMRRMIANQMALQIFSFLGGTRIGGILGIGGKAAGGPVSAGTPYMVGERGPELFMPGASGMIIPNHQLASGGNVFNFTNNVTSNGNMDAQTLIPILDENNRKVKAEFLNELSRGKYD